MPREDDHAAYKEMVEIELGKQHQVCRAHVERNVEEWSASIREQMKRETASLATLGLTPEQVKEDLALLQRLAQEHPPEGAAQLERLFHRYKEAPPPGKGKRPERLTGWGIKERYRTMRGYKRKESIKNVVFLTARTGVRSGHYDMAELLKMHHRWGAVHLPQIPFHPMNAPSWLSSHRGHRF